MSFCVTERDIGHCFIRVAGVFSACGWVCLQSLIFPPQVFVLVSGPFPPPSSPFDFLPWSRGIKLYMILLKPWDAFAATLVLDAESNQI